MNPVALRPKLTLFAQAMETTLRRHRVKGNSWQRCDIQYLEDRLQDEVKEFSVSHDPEELVDIANFCMMLWNRQQVTP